MTGRRTQAAPQRATENRCENPREARLKSALKANMAKRKAQGGKRAASIGAGGRKPDRNGT
jgi:hypothetical protein